MCRRNQRCGDECASPCTGEMCPTVMYYCQADMTCAMDSPMCEGTNLFVFFFRENISKRF